MIRALFRRHLRRDGRLLCGLVVGLAAMEALLVQVGAGFSGSDGFAQIVGLLPPALRAFIDSQIPNLADASASTFSAFGFQHPVVLVSSLAYVLYVASNVAAERESGLLDLLLARPVSRARYIASALLSIGVAAILPPLAVSGALAGTLPWVEPETVDLTVFLPCAAELAGFLFAIGCVTLLLATGSRRRGRTVVLVVAALAPLFLIDALAPLATWLERFRPLSPFHYLAPIQAVIRGSGSATNLVVFLGLSVVCACAAWLRFEAQDL